MQGPLNDAHGAMSTQDTSLEQKIEELMKTLSLATPSRAASSALPDAACVEQTQIQRKTQSSQQTFLHIQERFLKRKAIHALVQKYPNLRTLKLQVGKLNDEDVIPLQNLQHLTSLYLRSPHLTEEVFDYLEDIPRLSTLRLVSCQSIKNPSSGSLPDLMSLRHLEIADCRGLDATSIEGLFKRHPPLETLKLRRVAITDNVLAMQIAKMTTLRALVLDGCTGFTAQGLIFLAFGLSKLTQLHIYECEALTDKIVEMLACTPSLEIVSFKKCVNITDAALSYFTRFQRLWKVILSGCNKIGDIGIQYMLPCRSVRYFELMGYGNVTREGIDMLSSMQQLTELRLSTSQNVTVEAVTRLRQRSNLKLLLITPPPAKKSVHFNDTKTVVTFQVLPKDGARTLSG